VMDQARGVQRKCGGSQGVQTLGKRGPFLEKKRGPDVRKRPAHDKRFDVRKPTPQREFQRRQLGIRSQGGDGVQGEHIREKGGGWKSREDKMNQGGITCVNYWESGSALGHTLQPTKFCGGTRNSKKGGKVQRRNLVSGGKRANTGGVGYSIRQRGV